MKLDVLLVDHIGSGGPRARRRLSDEMDRYDRTGDRGTVRCADLRLEIGCARAGRKRRCAPGKDCRDPSICAAHGQVAITKF
jgi:hypothetical protein